MPGTPTQEQIIKAGQVLETRFGITVKSKTKIQIQKEIAALSAMLFHKSEWCGYRFDEMQNMIVLLKISQFGAKDK